MDLFNRNSKYPNSAYGRKIRRLRKAGCKCRNATNGAFFYSVLIGVLRIYLATLSTYVRMFATPTRCLTFCITPFEFERSNNFHIQCKPYRKCVYANDKAHFRRRLATYLNRGSDFGVDETYYNTKIGTDNVNSER